VHNSELENRTKQGRFHFRSRRMRDVLDALRKCEANGAGAAQFEALRTALIAWKSTDPEEFASRAIVENNENKLDRLFKELGLNPDVLQARPDLDTYIISCVQSYANVGLRPSARFVRYPGSVVDYMLTLFDQGKRAAVNNRHAGDRRQNSNEWYTRGRLHHQVLSFDGSGKPGRST
jgi:hypothetical protein